MEREDYLQFSFFIAVECFELGISQYQINEEELVRNDSFKCSGEHDHSIHLGNNELQLNIRGHHLDSVASILNERDLNASEQKGGKTKGFGHRRYPDANPQDGESLNSSRFFLNRVASKHSSLDEYPLHQ